MKTNTREHFTENPFAETEHPAHDVSRGFMDAAREPRVELPTITFEDHEVRTNLPPELLAEIFEPADHESLSHPFYRTLLPSRVDQIPVGQYFIGNPNDDNPYFDKEITVTDEGDGKRINYMRTGLLNNKGKNKNLLAALGYKIGFDGSPESLPTPQTLKEKAARLGVDIEYFPDRGKLDSKTYLSAFAAGRYPVGSGNSEFYAHDTADDHLTTMVLGGKPLKAALQRAAKEALGGGDQAEMDKRTGRIDEFTAYLRGTVSPTHNMMTYDYGEPIVQFVGKRLGLSPDEISTIIATARANAEKFGMELNPIDQKATS